MAAVEGDCESLCWGNGRSVPAFAEPTICLEAFPGAPSAETARTIMHVTHAKAWMDAVTAGAEAGYKAYPGRFTPTGVHPGAMPVAASERIGALLSERRVAWIHQKV